MDGESRIFPTELELEDVEKRSGLVLGLSIDSFDLWTCTLNGSVQQRYNKHFFKELFNMCELYLLKTLLNLSSA
jgi:hypothetical protein